MKRQHPIRDLRIELELASTTSAQERAISRHVKPLLDALERDGHGPRLSPHGDCPACDLLAAWREKL